MIDFRYHVVSIIAVFLALTVGLVLGSSFVGQAVLNNLRSQVDNDNANISKLQNQAQETQAALSYQDSVMNKVKGPLVSGRLTGHDVAVIVVPGASGAVVGDTVTTLKQAGATVVTQLTIEPAYSDVTQETQLGALATSFAPDGAVTDADPTPTAQQEAAYDLAAALTRRTLGAGSTTTPATTGPGGTQQSTGTLMTRQDALNILGAFSEGGFVSLSGNPAVAADMAVVIAGSANQTGAGQADSDQITLMKALTTLDATTVVGGTSASATSPGLIAAVIGDGTADKAISTVDTADSASGQIGLVFSLVDQFGGKVGHYGKTGTTDGPLPSIGTGTTGP